MLFSYVFVVYAVINILIAVLLNNKSKSSRVSSYYLSLSVALCIFGLTGILLSHIGNTFLKPLLLNISLAVYSAFPFGFLYFIILYSDNKKLLTSKSVKFGLVFTGLFSFAVQITGLVPQPLSYQRGLTPIGEIFYLIWMSILFSIGITQLFSTYGRISESGFHSKFMITGFFFLMLIVPSTFSTSVLTGIISKDLGAYLAFSILSLTFAVLFILRHKAITTVYDALRSAIGVMNDIFIKTDENFKIEMIGGGYSQILGYSEKELKGHNLTEFVAQKDILHTFKSFVLQGKMKDGYMDLDIIAKDGRKVTINSSVTATMLNDNLTGFVGIGRDVTAQKSMEIDLKKNEELLRNVVTNVPIIIFALNKSGIFTVSEGKGLDSLGLKPGEVVNRSAFELYKDFPNVISNIKLTLEGHSTSMIFRDRGKIFHCYFSPMFRSDNSVAGMIGAAIDITEQRQNEDAIRKLSLAVEQSPTSIMITDTSGRIEYVNPKFTELTGYAPSEILGENPRILKSGKTPTNVYIMMWGTIESGKEWRGEIQNRKKSGELYWESVSISPIISPEGEITHYLAVKEDITIKKRTEHELIEAKNKAEEANRLKSDFLAQISHEIRTPLNVILSMSAIIRNELEGKLSPEISTALLGISTSGKRLFRTIDLILNSASINSGEVEISLYKVDLDKKLQDMITDFKYFAENKNLELTYVNRTDCSHVISDDYMISQILQNIIDNAIKYTSAGKVEIDLYNEKENIICISVKDTGIGISEEYLNKLFTPFTQEDEGYSRRFEGNGLGLALSKQYADLIGAELSVDSKKGKGSVFTLKFDMLKNFTANEKLKEAAIRH